MACAEWAIMFKHLTNSVSSTGKNSPVTGISRYLVINILVNSLKHISIVVGYQSIQSNRYYQNKPNTSIHISKYIKYVMHLRCQTDNCLN